MLLLKNGKILTMDEKQVVYGDILIENGKIKEIGGAVDCPGAETIDLKNNIVMPGLIDGYCHVGLIENGVGFPGDDMNENSESINSQLSVEDGINIRDISFKEAYQSGVTTLSVCPGNKSIIGGKSCILKTYGNSLDEMIIKRNAALNISIGDSCKKLDDKNPEMPRSRMAIMDMLRSFFENSKNYLEKKSSGEIDYSKYNKKYEEMDTVFKKEMPLQISAHKAQDIQSAMKLGKMYGLNTIINYCTEGYMIIDQLVKANSHIMLGPYLTDKSSNELINRKDEIPNILSQRDIMFCLTTDHPEVPVQLLSMCAAVAVKNGLDYLRALKAITINPARILGIDDRVGSLEVGKDADIVVFDGDPLKTSTNVVMTLLNGSIIYKNY
ncbi:amidohydrolase family protein [Maledivibacter halophilus]|uniref:Imidazolonepropionase n=1 Tax=Maledivibacter halophilus TaxID=36842 RepID=A0A1T5KPP2_9FIRM|nr:amidohydrolase family protein [Maledivibacter halophilus]SKC65726.1 Imidazolonepropionase [Maledivibacter halophilus]